MSRGRDGPPQALRLRFYEEMSTVLRETAEGRAGHGGERDFQKSTLETEFCMGPWREEQSRLQVHITVSKASSGRG